MYECMYVCMYVCIHIKAYAQLIKKILEKDINKLFWFISSRKISHVMPVYQYNSRVTSESHDILVNYVASSFTWHKCYGALRPRGNTKKPKSPEEMFAKTGIPDPETDGSDDTGSELLGSCAGWTPNDRSLRKHEPKDIKQEKHQRDETLGASPAKRAKSDPIEIDDFYLNDEDNIEDFDAGNLDLKVSPLKFMKPEIKTGI